MSDAWIRTYRVLGVLMWNKDNGIYHIKGKYTRLKFCGVHIFSFSIHSFRRLRVVPFSLKFGVERK